MRIKSIRSFKYKSLPQMFMVGMWKQYPEGQMPGGVYKYAVYQDSIIDTQSYVFIIWRNASLCHDKA